MTQQTTADRYIRDPDRLLGRTYDLFGGGVVRVDHYFPPTEAHTEALAVRVLDTQDLVRLDARTWRDLEVAGAIYEC
jgi:hypothetical protein